MTEDELREIENRVGLEHSWHDVQRLIDEVRFLQAALEELAVNHGWEIDKWRKFMDAERRAKT